MSSETTIPAQLVPGRRRENYAMGTVSSGNGVWARWIGRPMTELRMFTIEANAKRWSK